MQVIFLDIDGVLNSEAYALKLEERHRQLRHVDLDLEGAPTCTCFKLYRQIDRAAVGRVDQIATATSAKIVVSSTWRKLFDLSELRRMLVEHGLSTEIVGVTPDGYKDPDVAAMYGHGNRLYRGHEIDFWLSKHRQVDRFVILDDDSDMAMHKKRLVQTDCQEGLLDEHIDLALRVMAWDGKGPHPYDKRPEIFLTSRG